ncbi:hypothetical protein OUZ56_013442 [Daphnia magna]|uniref:Transmembrane protein n=1 Tax=Daphnia magna TaxID=35525 RepID=A0ABQ9Z5X3_9CRUS|nr:hypothetical protein OUZ56_013442 [Daphnia magna]
MYEGHYSLHEDHHPVQSTTESLSTVLLSLQHPREFSLLILLFFSPLLSQLTWIGFNTISIFWTANIHLSWVQHCRFDNFGSFAPNGPHAFTFSSSSFRCCLRLRLIAVLINVFASSLSSSTSSPHHCLRRRLRLHLRLVVVLAVFAFVSSPSWPSLSTPSPRRHHLVAGFAFRGFTVDRRPACRDRPQWPSPQGALGNAPVGTSLCRCSGGFLRVCIPCNGFRHLVSPDLSSDKSHLVRDPYDAMRS